MSSKVLLVPEASFSDHTFACHLDVCFCNLHGNGMRIGASSQQTESQALVFNVGSAFNVGLKAGRALVEDFSQKLVEDLVHVTQLQEHPVVLVAASRPAHLPKCLVDSKRPVSCPSLDVDAQLGD